MDEFRECNEIECNSKYKHQRTIVHIDLDCFYAQVEILKNPDLVTKPVGIKQQHYVITSNYVARDYGVKKCMLITEALALCPKLVLINGEDLHDYRIMSSKVTDVIRQFSNRVEKLGLDENFVDVSELVSTKLSSKSDRCTAVVGHVYMNNSEYDCSCGCSQRLILGSHIASEIRAKIKEDLGMTCCAGIGHNKLLAKLVCSSHKPNQQTTIFPCAATYLISKLSHVRAIPGVGRRTSNILDSLGINSILDLQNCTQDLLEKHLDKSLARWVKGACFGVDDTEIKESGKQQVIGLEEAAKMISSMADIQNRFKSLIERGVKLLQEDGRYPSAIRVTVRKYSPGDYTRQRESKQCTISTSIFKTGMVKEQILEITLNLFKKLVDPKKPFHLTLIGLAFTKFQEELPVKNSLLPFLRKSIEHDLKSSAPETITKNIQKNDKRDVPKILNTGNLCCQEERSPLDLYENIDKSVLDELPEDIRNEIMGTMEDTVNKPGTSSPKKIQNSAQCPLGVDAQVFNELPYEIQQEIIKDSTKSNNFIRSKKSTTNQKQSSILKFLNK